MTRFRFACALSLLVGLSGVALAQDEAPPPPPPSETSPASPPPSSPPPASTAPAAQTQFHAAGSEVFPGKFMVGLDPLGVQARFDGNSVSGYKFTTDVSGLLKSFDSLSLWLGGGFGYTYGSLSPYAFANHDLQLWAFVTLTFEKLIRFPLVPFARAGIGGDILLYDVTGGNLSGGAFAIRLGGGAYYWILRNLGLGVETDFTMGPGFYPAAITGGCGLNNNTCTAFFGNWDFLLGGRFAF